LARGVVALRLQYVCLPVCLPIIPDQASSDLLILGLLGLRLE
jgi:hypothetical protein